MFKLVSLLIPALFVGILSRIFTPSALVAAPFEASVILGSKNDKTRTLRLKGNAGITTYDEMVTALVAFLTDLTGVSAGVVKSYTITGRAIENAYTRPTDSDAEWRDTALIVTEVDDQPLKTANIQIPMPKIGIFRGTEGVLMDEIDTGDAALIAYIDNFRPGGSFTVSDGEQVGTVIREGKRLS